MNVLSRVLFSFVVVAIPLQEAMACGHPIVVLDRASGEYIDMFGNPPAGFVLPDGACLSKNYIDCNTDHIFFGFGAGPLLFSDHSRFCSDDDRTHLRWLYVKVHTRWLAFLTAFIACVLWLLSRSRQANAGRGITTGATGGKATNDDQNL